MTAAKHLPIYRDAYRLVAHLHQVTRKAPRDLRHTLVQRLLDEGVECCVDIADANRATGPDRAARIERLAGRIARVDTLLTLTNSYLGIAGHADTWNKRGAWCAAAAARGLVAAPDRSKVMARPTPEGHS